MNTWHVGDSPYALPTQVVRLDPRTVSLAVGVLCAVFAGAFAVGRLTPHGHGASSSDYASRPPSLSATSVSAGVTARLGVVPAIGDLPVVRRVIPHASRPAPSAPVQSTPSNLTPAASGHQSTSTPAAPERAAVPSRPAPPPSSPAPAVSPAPAPTGGAAPGRESSGGGSSGRQTGGGSSGRHGGGGGGSFDSSG